MSVIQSSLPDEQTLYAVLPHSRYEHSTAFERRTVLSRSPKEAGLVAPTSHGAGQNFSFIFDRSVNCLLSLQETYFNISGYLQISQTAVDAAANIMSSDMLKCSQQWILSAFNTCTLKLGSKEIEKRSIPIVLNDFQFMMKGSHRDIEAGVYEQEQFFYGRGYDAKIGTAHTTTLNPRKHAPMVNATIGDFEFTNTTTGTTTAAIDVPFSCYLPLSAIFSVDTFKPVFNTEVSLTLLFESSNDVSIGLGPVNKVTLKNFTKFECDFVQYTMNENFQKLVGKVYAKPQIVVVDHINSVFQTLQNQRPNSQVQLSTPFNMMFDLKDLHIAFPKSTTNGIRQDWNLAPVALTKTEHLYNEKWMNSAPHAYMPVPLAQIKVQVDGYDLLDRNFQTEDVTIRTRATFADDKNINIGMATSNAGTTYNTNYYTALYNNYLLCRRYHDQMQDGVSLSRFLFDKFMISMPCYQFSRITTGSSLNVTLSFPGYVINPFHVPTSNTEFGKLAEAKDPMDINQMLIIQHASRAIQFNNGNIDVKDISQTFSNEIELD